MGYKLLGIIFFLSFVTLFEACVIVPKPVILFPLNAEYQTRDIKNRTAPGIPSGVSLAPGPYGEKDGSFEFFGNANSFIEFPNSPGGALDVRYSMTILCWVYYDENGGPDGPIFNYNTGGRYGVHFWVLNRLFWARFNDRAFTSSPFLRHTLLAGGWKFVGASYDNETGEIKLWADGALKQTRKMNAGVELGTQGSVRMGVRKNDHRCFKGKISQLQIYDVALSQRQMSELTKKPEDPYRILEFKQATAFQSSRLTNHVIRTIDNVDVDSCELLCLLEDNCTPKIQRKGTICELNNSTHVAHPDDFKKPKNYIYRGIKNPCDESLCQHSSICQAGFTDKGYRCLCAGRSCSMIREIIGEEAISGSYMLNQNDVKFKVYCHMESEDNTWTLIARFSNTDNRGEWMRDHANWWYRRTEANGKVTNPSDNDDMISPAFWSVSGQDFKITRGDDLQHTALLRTKGDCLRGQTLRAKITSYGSFRNTASWEIQPNVDGCRGSCNVSYAGRFQETVGFKQANCSGKIQGAEKIGFWCAIESTGSVMMIGGGGQPCALGDHGIGITSKGRSFYAVSSGKVNDFGDAGTVSPEMGYSLNLWIQ
ncbi:hypothetical protein P5673_031628 [Acropora cervicornis]|uniref:Uncharacterized protein n=1 Tax=Acropora cervicornis TaxID=6130 RepID=A0AAD9USP6_ACRCE|nr:hypothetical protein P5673_031628 [Acropora cervicornis]